MRHFLATAGLCALATSAPAQNAFILVEPNAPQSFVIITQPQADHAIQLDIRPETPLPAIPSDAEWERHSPSNQEYPTVRSIRWFATASCPDGIQTLRIQGPNGSETQNLNGSRNAISGRSLFDSFDGDALDQVCLDYAASATAACGNLPHTEPGCETQRTFSFDEISPLPGSPPVRVSGQCTGGPIPVQEVTPRLELTCRLGAF